MKFISFPILSPLIFWVISKLILMFPIFLKTEPEKRLEFSLAIFSSD